ncbi:MAG: phosphoadenosine phosphosulfate reductase family protein, partial [Akkermansiaceae bacterium]|nr:phosphoadenosine phosphosulfate reductase family protein [Akkermansiaceae bacterium]NIT76235.1 phosphoadenosine phosphosulfate reductase family protein [Thermoplasmata archaeon]NIY02606.1 phosphoadenosine phosphosulfate reductase family protein [Thermoplasmata archaeon]
MAAADSTTTHRHILALSGGKDSTALAILMREKHPDLPIEYCFADTGRELPDLYRFLDDLEGFLG